MKVLINIPFGAVHNEHWVPSRETSDSIVNALASLEFETERETISTSTFGTEGAVRVLETLPPNVILTRSHIYHRHRCFEAEMADGYWLTVHSGDSDYPPGVLRSRWALPEDGDDVTFTAPNGKRYMDVPSCTKWTALPLVV